MLKRESKYELLRIVAMLMIVAFHAYSQLDTYDPYSKPYILIKWTAGNSWNKFVAVCLGSWGLTGVGCFFLLSASFLTRRNSFSIKKCILIILQTVFWSVLITILAVLFHTFEGSNDIEPVKYIMKSIILPFVDVNVYWYIIAYLFMYLLSPFMNQILAVMDMEIYKRFIIVLTIIVPVYSTLTNGSSITASNLALAVYYYILYSYLQRTSPEVFIKKYAGSVFVATVVFVTLSHLLVYHYGWQDIFVGKLCERFSIFQIIAAVALFYIFERISCGYYWFINIIASGTLGVYLIHENPNLKFFLWNRIINLDYFYSKRYFAIVYITSVILVFCVGVTLDLARKYTFEAAFKKVLKLFDNHFGKIDDFINCRRND
ncbi:MAG: acyltransferase [Lachnospiraceae bacterium]|nr:acyltransferase [Lachnospiraceae bacterium]